MTWQPAAWVGPRFAAYAPVLAALPGAGPWPSVAAIDNALGGWLRGDGHRPVRLVEPARGAPLYEVQIVERGEVPTRPDNAHDLWNAIVWATFPHAKWALADRLGAVQQARAAAGPRLPGTRTPIHDRMALVDEGGLVLAGTRAVVFGHAILEHAARGIATVRGAPIAIAPATWSAAVVDRALAAAIVAGALGSGPGVAIDDAQLGPWSA